MIGFRQGDQHELYQKFQEVEQEEFYNESRDFTCFLCPKKKELGDIPRLFVKQVRQQRGYQTVMKDNLKTIMKYIPEQTMTAPEIVLSKRIIGAAKTLLDGGEFLSMDFLKWNAYFRNVLCQPFGRILDDLFGTRRIYTQSHHLYLRTNLLCNSRLCPPEYDENLNPKDGPFCLAGQYGGLDGMHQKKWTIMTICLIYIAAARVQLRVNIICQGDNQSIIIVYQENQKNDKERLRAKFQRQLKLVFESVNWFIKTKETWMSKRLFEYGKVRYFNGKSISQATKKII